MKSPFEVYSRKHNDHPDLSLLIQAERVGDIPGIEKLAQEISRDGWREHLENIHVTDTKTFFAYLARADGRKSLTKTSQRMDPLLDREGARHFELSP